MNDRPNCCPQGQCVDLLWRPIETAPQDGTLFLAFQDGEVYVSRFTPDRKPRLTYRTHKLMVHSRHRVIDAKMDGQPVKAHVEVEKPWKEEFRHDWTLWERGFDFNPTAWSPMPSVTP